MPKILTRACVLISLLQGCENAVECVVDRAQDEALDIICSCSNTFCFNCKEESHRPVSV